MILLELTEKEAALVEAALIKEKYFWDDAKEGGRTLIDNNLRLCNSVWAKLDAASKPQKDELITYKDLFLLISSAKREYMNLRPDIQISNKPVDLVDFPHISVANALIMWLNSKNLLKKLARFDFTDNQYQYEETDE